MPQRSRYMVLLVACLWVSACGWGRDSSSQDFLSIDTLPSGAVRLHYENPAESSIPLVDMDLSVGSVESDSNFIFGNVRGLDVGRDGSIYVLDYQASEVRAFDGHGNFLRKVATRGQGPGEITEANGMVMVGDSVIWLQDHSQMMMIGVSTEGEELGRFPMHVRRYGYIWDGTVDNRGRVWKNTSHSDEEPEYPPREGLHENRYREYWISFDPTTEVKDSIYTGDVSSRSMVFRNNRGGNSYVGVPHEPRPRTVVDPDGGLWRASGAAYSIVRFDEHGDTVLVIQAEAQGPAVTADDRTEYVEDLVERNRATRRVAEDIAALMPDNKPAIVRLVVDDVGHLWVERTAPEGARPQLDAYDRDGRYLGSVELMFSPYRYAPFCIRQGRVYAVVLDEMDVPFVVRSRAISFDARR